jgi:hypothetical protein
MLLMSLDPDPPRGRPERGRHHARDKTMSMGRERDFLL